MGHPNNSNLFEELDHGDGGVGPAEVGGGQSEALGHGAQDISFVIAFVVSLRIAFGLLVFENTERADKNSFDLSSAAEAN